MIAKMLTDFQAYLKKNCGSDVLFFRSPNADQTPIISISQDGTGEFLRMANEAMAITVPIKVTAYTTKENVFKCYEMMTRIIKVVPLFKENTGYTHRFVSGVVSESDDDFYMLSMTVAINCLIVS